MLKAQGLQIRVRIESKKKCKDRELIQSSTTSDPGYQWESDNAQLDITNEGLVVKTWCGT